MATREEERRLPRGGLTGGGSTAERGGLAGVVQRQFAGGPSGSQVANLERELALGTYRGGNTGPQVTTGGRSTAESPQGVGSRTVSEIKGGEVTQRVTAPRQSAAVPPAQRPGNAALRNQRGAGPRATRGELPAPSTGLGNLYASTGPVPLQGQGALAPPGAPQVTALSGGNNRYQLRQQPGAQPVGVVTTPQGQARFQYGTGRFGGTTAPSAFRSGGGVSVISGRTAQEQAAIDRQVGSFERAAQLMEGNRLMRRGLNQNRALNQQEQARLNELRGLGQKGRQGRQRQQQKQQESAFDQNLALREQARKEAQTQQGAMKLRIDVESARQAREAGQELDPLTQQYLEAFDQAERMNRDAISPEERVNPEDYANSILKRALAMEGVAIVNGQRVPRRNVQLMAERQGVSPEEFAQANGIYY